MKMKCLYTIVCTLLLSFSLLAKEENNERVYVHLDKDSYLAGEDILFKFYVVDPSFNPSDFSRIGYVEVCNTEKPYLQYKVAIEEGRGAGKMRIPLTMPTGMYQLTGYTRYMRNEGEDVFFKRKVAIINMNQAVKDENIELVTSSEIAGEIVKRDSQLSITTDKATYRRRDQVSLTLGNLPSDISDLIVSVVRNDTITTVPQVNYADWEEQVRKAPVNFSGEWLPEYEGHIITGKMTSASGAPSSIGFVGKDICLSFGKVHEDQTTVSYFTENVYGKQEVVTSVLSGEQQVADDCRVDIVSPFADVFPPELPPVKIASNKKQLIDRFIGVQVDHLSVSGNQYKDVLSSNLLGFKPVASYDLDQYTRFKTVGQTIVEFISWIAVRRVGGEPRLKVYFKNENQYNTGNTLVLLDGIPLYDHNYILNYNPVLIKMVHVYDGMYTIGGEVFDCMVSFVSHNVDLPSIQLGGESQLFVYDCPELPVKLDNQPDYSDSNMSRSLKPDFRHTLYWEPFGEYEVDGTQPILFYTSDLTGSYTVTVEGITQQGKWIYGNATFSVDR